jgi:DNA mismatch endonuclease (patch repair protein)
MEPKLEKPNDTPSPLSENVSRQMRNSRESDTEPELAVRKLLHASGLRYRIQFRIPFIPRRSIDIAFPKAKVAVFIDGCFWHGCTTHKTIPKNNNAWWSKKINANRTRDHDTNEKLAAAGWSVLRFWEHEPSASIAQTITDTLWQRRSSHSKE